MSLVLATTEAPTTVAPAEACVTAIVCAPRSRPLPAIDATPSPDPPDATSNGPLATTSFAEATVPLETNVLAVASCSTEKVVEPAWAPVPVVAVATEELLELAETAPANASG